jgi:hypothetical protein
VPNTETGAWHNGWIVNSEPAKGRIPSKSQTQWKSSKGSARFKSHLVWDFTETTSYLGWWQLNSGLQASQRMDRPESRIKRKGSSDSTRFWSHFVWDTAEATSCLGRQWLNSELQASQWTDHPDTGDNVQYNWPRYSPDIARILLISGLYPGNIRGPDIYNIRAISGQYPGSGYSPDIAAKKSWKGNKTPSYLSNY